MKRFPVISSRAAALSSARAGGPDAAPILVVPSMPVPAYEPPPAPAATVSAPQPIGGRGNEYEAARLPIALPGPDMLTVANGLGGLFSKELTIFSSQQAWTGCDVYVDTADLGTATDYYLKVRVYSLVQSVRTLVDSAFLPLQIAAQRVWACAARALGERFDVTVQLCNIGGALAFPVTELSATVICSDKSTDVRASSQALSVAGEQVFPFTNAIPFTHETMRLTGYALTSNAAAPVWLQFRNGALTTDPIVHTVGVNPGESIMVRESKALESLLFPDGIMWSLSTDPEAYAFPGANLVYWSAFYK